MRGMSQSRNSRVQSIIMTIQLRTYICCIHYSPEMTIMFQKLSGNDVKLRNKNENERHISEIEMIYM